MRKLLFAFAFLILNSSFGIAGDIKFRNSISNKLYIAVVYYKNHRWISKGWYHLYPGETKTLIYGNNNSKVYWYATMENSDADYEGNYFNCVNPNNAFTKYDSDYSWCNGEKKGFNEINVGSYDTFTFKITSESNCRGNCKNGYGSAYDKGKIFYQGDWKNGKMHGKGTFYYSDGSKYTGDWKYGKQDGYGKETYDNGYYTGPWKKGKRNGRGTYKFNNGNKYVGIWKNSERTGKGTFYWKSGDKYIGDFVDGDRTGQGTYFWKGGNKWAGKWYKGDRVGKGIFTSSNGTTKKGIWVNDEWKYHCTFRLILVMNTNDVSIGKNAEKIKKGYKDFYRQVAKKGDMKFSIKTLSGSNFSYKTVKRYIDNFQCDDNDVVVFHYFGHGGRYSNTESRWPIMLMSNYASLNEAGISLDYVKKKLYSQSNARLGLFFADCCNSSRYEPENCEPEGTTILPRYVMKKSAIEALYVGNKGSLSASSSSKGQFSSADNGGTTVYTMAFSDAMNAHLQKYNPSWEGIMTEIQGEVYDMTKNCEYNNTKQKPQHEVLTNKLY